MTLTRSMQAYKSLSLKEARQKLDSRPTVLYPLGTTTLPTQFVCEWK